MRIAKALASAGIGSRRTCEKYVTEGKVKLNGTVIFDLGRQVDPEKDKIQFRGSLVRLQKPIYFMLNKPKGFVTTASDPKAKKTVFDLLPADFVKEVYAKNDVRVFTVGRLDKDSTGLLLFTNNGDLANKLMHPRYQIEKWYEVKIDKPFNNEDEAKLLKGIWLSDGKAKINGFKKVTPSLLRVMLTEGKKREIRRLFAKLEYKVKSLQRVSYGPLQLKGLAIGRGRSLTQKEISLLKKITS